VAEFRLYLEVKGMTIVRYEAHVKWRRHGAVLSVDKTESCWCWRMNERDSPIQVGGLQATLDEGQAESGRLPEGIGRRA
jgi:hypothetical protein